MSTTVSMPRSIETIAPFRHSSESRAATAARIVGSIPDWLRGEVVRTCPTIFQTPGWHAQHWFDALGMIYAFRIGPSGVDFRSRLLDSETARDAWAGRSELAAYGTPTTRSLSRRLLQPVPRPSDNANVNVRRMGNALVAMTESDRQHLIDDETLASAGTVGYAEDALGRAVMTAHPHFDFERGHVVNVATKFGAGGEISVYEHAPTVRRRTVVASWRVKHIPYVHAFGLTPRSAILVGHPFTVTPLRMLWSNKGYIDHFEWHPEEGVRLAVMDRTTQAIREHVTDAFFAFHTVNAFELDGAIVLDLLAYANADIVGALRVERMLAELPDLRASLLRITLRPGIERATTEKLSDVGFEFPSTNYQRVNGHAYRYAWGASNGPEAGGAYRSSIVKVDLKTGTSSSFADGVHIFGEPLFAARPYGDGEDDGVLLSVGSSQDAETSILAIIDAKSMALVSSAEVQGSIPLGFHGSFASGHTH